MSWFFSWETRQGYQKIIKESEVIRMDTLDYKENLSYSDIQKMYRDLDDIIALVEHTNEILTYKIKANRSIFTSFVKSLLLINNQSLGSMLKFHHLLDKTLQDYLQGENRKGGC